MKINYEYKSLVLKSGMPDALRKIQFYRFKYFSDSEISSQLIDAELLLRNINVPYYIESYKINHAYANRKWHLKKRVSKILTSSCDYILFVTFTFTDLCLNSTSFDTRRRYVTRFLKDRCLDYVANIDFGARKGREHYHAIICTNEKIDFNWWIDNCGAVKYVPVRISDVSSSARLSSYITKLTNHAIKDTARRYALIFPRNRR